MQEKSFIILKIKELPYFSSKVLIFRKKHKDQIERDG